MNDIRIVRERELAWVILDRPQKRNAVTSAMWQFLPQLAREFSADTTTRVVLLRGAGDAAFSAGADIAEMQTGLSDMSALKIMQQAVQDGQTAWADMDRPTIAVIQGACTGGGCGLALACDLRIATPESFFAIPPAKLGLVYSLVDTRRLTDLVGPSRAKEMLFTGRRVPAAQALEWGLIDRVVAAADLESTSRDLAREITAAAQSSVRAAKRIVNAISAGARDETPESRRLYDESFTSAEFREGALAFLEKRPARY